MYGGELFKGNPDYHPPMIDYALWKRVQDVFARPERSKRKVTDRQHPYIGLVKCGGHILDAEGRETNEVCGCSITGEEKRKTLADGTINTLATMMEENADYIETGSLLIELAQRTETIFKSATPAIKRKLVEIVSSNRILKDGRLEYDYRKPFDMLAKVETKENWWR